MSSRGVKRRGDLLENKSLIYEIATLLRSFHTREGSLAVTIEASILLCAL